MRRFWQSTEFYAVSLLSLVLMLMCERGAIPYLHGTAEIVALILAYTTGRVLWKKNRGQFYSGLFTSEFGLTAVYSLWTLRIGFGGKVDPLYAVSGLVLLVCVYCIGRGLTKGIGVRTQVVHA